MARGNFDRIYTKVYAVYKGDDLIVVGTSKECADYMGVSPRYIHRMVTPAHHKYIKEKYKKPDRATFAIKLEGE